MALKDRRAAMMAVQLDFPPEVLQQKARDIASSLGYPDRPADQWISLGHRPKLLEHLNSLPEPKKWKDWLTAEAPFERVFEAAGLDRSTFTETASKSVPRQAADSMRAWHGPHPVIPKLEMEVEVASWHGRITEVKVLWPWQREAESAAQPAARRARGLVAMAAGAIGLLFAVLLARRNWKRGRVDPEGRSSSGNRSLRDQFLYMAGHGAPGTERRDALLFLL